MILKAAQNQLKEFIVSAEQPHLLVKKYGSSLIIYSLDVQKHVQKHARMTHLGVDQWGLSFPRYTGRWEKTPFQGSILELWEIILKNFPFLLIQH